MGNVASKDLELLENRNDYQLVYGEFRQKVKGEREKAKG